VGRCSETGVNVFRKYGNVWCPWEVGPRKKDARVRIPSLALKSSFEATVTLAQLVERRTFNPVVVGSSPTCDKFFYLKYISSYIFNDR
jgi:hypothetical protein